MTVRDGGRHRDTDSWSSARRITFLRRMRKLSPATPASCGSRGRTSARETISRASFRLRERAHKDSSIARGRGIRDDEFPNTSPRFLLRLRR